MEINDLIKKLANEFEEVPAGTLKPETSFRELKEWSSMHALIIIALVDTEYDVILNGEDLRSVTTIQDLFDFIKRKKGL